MFVHIVRPKVCEGMECLRFQVSVLKSQVSHPLERTQTKQFALRFREQARVVVAMRRFDLRELHILFHVLEAAHANQRGGDARS